MSKKKILNIYNDKDILDVLDLTLSEQYYVDGVETIEEGIRFIKEAPPDLVIIKHRMPEFDAISTIEKIRELNSEIKTFILSSGDTAEDIAKYIGSNADDYVILPFDPGILLAKIRKHFLGTAPKLSRINAEIQKRKKC